MTATTPLRIGITCYPTFGGSGIIATEIGLSLARRGHRVHFVSYDIPGRLDRFVDNVFFHEVEVSDYPLFQGSSGGGGGGHYSLALASKLVEVCTWEKLDLLHVHYAIPHATSAYLARQILGPSAPRIVCTLHGTDITLVGNDASFLPITRFSVLQSDGITTPSDYLRDVTYKNLDVPRTVPIEVIPNFVDDEKYRPVEKRRWEVLAPLFARREGGLPSSLASARPRVLIHNSNFRPLKRVDDVIRIFAEVRRAVPAVLILIGDGPERSRVEGMVRGLGLDEAVCFLGKQLSFVEVLQNGDVFLLPSETESFGLAALEALSCGMPVVASDVGGLPEVVSHGRSGYLHPVGDVAAMSASIVGMLRDHELHARMSQAARTSVEQTWRREPIVDKYEAYYRRVLAAPSPLRT